MDLVCGCDLCFVALIVATLRLLFVLLIDCGTVVCLWCFAVGYAVCGWCVVYLVFVWAWLV